MSNFIGRFFHFEHRYSQFKTETTVYDRTKKGSDGGTSLDYQQDELARVVFRLCETDFCTKEWLYVDTRTILSPEQSSYLRKEIEKLKNGIAKQKEVRVALIKQDDDFLKGKEPEFCTECGDVKK